MLKTPITRPTNTHSCLLWAWAHVRHALSRLEHYYAPTTLYVSLMLPFLLHYTLYVNLAVYPIGMRASTVLIGFV